MIVRPALAAILVLAVSEAGLAQDRAALPPDVAVTLARTEGDIADAWSSLDDLPRLQALLPAAEAAFEARRRHQGDEWWQTIDARHDVATLRRLVAAPAETRHALAQALSDRERLGALDRPGTQREGLALARAIVDVHRRVLGDDHPSVAAALLDAAHLLDALGEAGDAEALETQALELRRRSLGEHHPLFADSLSRAANRRLAAGPSQHGQVEAWHLQALAIRLQALGERDPATAASLHDLAHVHFESGRYADAEPVYRRALALRRDLLGPRDADYGATLNGLALVLAAAGRPDEAEPLYREALAIFDPNAPADVDAYATIADNLAGVHRARGQFADAEQRYLEALRLRQTLASRGPYATSLNNLAVLYLAMGRFDDAEARCREAVSILEAAGSGGAAFASALDTRAAIAKSRGRYEDAEPDYLRAFEIRRAALGDAHPDVALSFNNLGNLRNLQGDLAGAEAYYRRALEVSRQAAGERQLTFAITTSNLAHVLHARGRAAEAEPLFDRALALMRDGNRRDHPAYVAALNNLAWLYGSTDRRERAEALYLEAIAIVERTLGESTPTLGTLHNNLGDLYMGMRAYDRAERSYRRAVTIRERAVGPDHPAYASSLAGVGSALAAVKSPEAANFLFESAAGEWRHLTRNFPTMSPVRKREFLDYSAFNQGDRLVTLALSGLAKTEQALEGVLLSKQLLLEVARSESGALLAAVDRAPEEWRGLWREYLDLKRRFVELALQAGPGSAPGGDAAPGESSPETLRRMSDRIEALDRQLRRGNAEYARLAHLQRITLADASKALRSRDALLEYVHYRPFDFANGVAGAAPHYAAFVKRGDGAPIVAVDLGPADAIDALVASLCAPIEGLAAEFGAGTQYSASKLGRMESAVAGESAALAALVWTPLAASLAGIERVYVAPDRQLSLVPFEILARATDDGGWRYLVEDLEIVHVGTARDLGRFVLDHTPPGRPKTAVLVGDPDFDASPRQVAAAAAALRGSRLMTLADRPSTAVAPATHPTEQPCVNSKPRGRWPRASALSALISQAAGQLRAIGWSVETFEGERAVEEAVFASRAPQILQIASHGHFAEVEPHCKKQWVNSLVQSMLLFAGVNHWTREAAAYYEVGGSWREAQDEAVRALTDGARRAARTDLRDGVLTAYEVSGLDLRGAELVNLTACHTGQGVITPDGVAGLRQAFVLAGARSVTMSMWEVPAVETVEQIAGFYAAWLGTTADAARAARYPAFRRAQLAALARAREAHQTGHPFFWAGTIFVGDPGDLPEAPITQATRR